MSKLTRQTFTDICVKLNIEVPANLREDHKFNEYLLGEIKTALNTYDPTAAATGDAAVTDVLAGKTFSNATGVDLEGTLTLADLTGDATALDTDILIGASAYVDGLLVEGVFDPLLDTSDATAVETDIMAPATAYVNGVKLTGVLTLEALTPGTATATDIMLGASAWVAGLEVTGTYEPLDTSDATAIAEDIALGKTAYVNGVLITGTAV